MSIGNARVSFHLMMRVITNIKMTHFKVCTHTGIFRPFRVTKGYPVSLILKNKNKTTKASDCDVPYLIGEAQVG